METKKTVTIKSKDFLTGTHLPEDAKSVVAEDFIRYAQSNGAEIEKQRTAYQTAGRWLAECAGAWAPKYIEQRFRLETDEGEEEHSSTKRESFFESLRDKARKTFGYDTRLIGETPFLPPQKGLLIYGEVGRGKTFLARHIFRFFQKFIGRGKAVFIYDTEFNIGTFTKGNAYLEEFFFGNDKKVMFFDDIGNENDMRAYGNTFSGKEIIRYRHICREKWGTPTVLTTNLTAESLANRYGIYVESRVASDYKGIFVDYPFDRRKQRTA